jgi:hypothetical protein
LGAEERAHRQFADRLHMLLLLLFAFVIGALFGFLVLGDAFTSE